VPVAVTLKFAPAPGLTVVPAGWAVIDTGSFTVKAATELVTLPATFVTTTV
jgi:hypothetical protein